MMDVVGADLPERVSRGAALLDEKVPGWAHRINVDTLDVESGTDCIVAQLFGDYLNGINALGLSFMSDDDAAHGYNSTFDESSELPIILRVALFDQLHALWIKEITTRLAE